MRWARYLFLAEGPRPIKLETPRGHTPGRQVLASREEGLVMGKAIHIVQSVVVVEENR